MTNLARAYDRLFSERRKMELEHAMVYLSIAGFGIHLLVVFFARMLEHPAPWITTAGQNYLAALYTPFSFILFYEVLMLVWALPESTTDSIAKQYEIVSLIFIRGVFKAIADIQNISQIEKPEAALPILIDMGAGLGMFLLVTVFKAVARRRMIFTDVLVLILSLLVSDRYELVFRNAAFVGSTILIRASLTTNPPYSAPIALFSMVFGILTLAVYNYHSRLHGEERAV